MEKDKRDSLIKELNKILDKSPDKTNYNISGKTNILIKLEGDVSMIKNNKSRYATMEDLHKLEIRIDEKIDDLKNEMNAKFKEIDIKFEEMNAKFKKIDIRFEEMNTKFKEMNTNIINAINSLKS